MMRFIHRSQFTHEGTGKRKMEKVTTEKPLKALTLTFSTISASDLLAPASPVKPVR